MNSRLLQLGLGLSLVLCCESPVLGFAQSAAAPVHQWFTIQAQLFFRSQFGPSEIDGYVGEERAYPGGENRFVAEGAFDEDEGDNPYNQSQPFNRHFWVHDGAFQRVHDDGLGRFDSAASRAIQYFNGGNTILNNYLGPSGIGCGGGGWSCRQGSVEDQGIVWRYENDTGNDVNKRRAYYWLGNAAHLLQDLALPVHSHSDAHLELTGANDPDPVHDWVDGRPFRTDGAMGARGTAAFDDIRPNRWREWAYHDGGKGIGRPAGGAAAFDRGDIRSPADFLALRATLPREQANSIPARPTGAADRSVYDDALPLYVLTLDLSGRADDFDSDDVNGQTDAGARRNAVGDTDRNQYNNWMLPELYDVADVAAVRAIRATSELYRYFYSLVDSTPPVVTLPGLSATQDRPTIRSLGLFPLEVGARDSISGYDLNGFSFQLEKFDGTAWTVRGTTSPSTPNVFINANRRGLFRISASVENGGGTKGTSAFGYYRVVPEPSSVVLMLGALLVASMRRTIFSHRGDGFQPIWGLHLKR